jgi:hypothetical protein
MGIRLSLLSGVISAAFFLPTYGYAQVQPGSTNVELKDGMKIFAPAYFDKYSPNTALDMVDQIPGFQLEGSDGKRGLGQGGANVLINGERISGKTDPGDQLSRITAPNVVRIEIVDGASLDIPGLSGQVANVITKNTGVSGTWEWRPEFRTGLKANVLSGSLTVSGETGNLSYSATLRNNAFRNGSRGLENRFTPDGITFETRDEDSQFYGDNPGIATSLTWKPKDGHVGNLNAEYNQFNFNQRENSLHTAFGARGDNNQTIFSFAEDEWNAEIGGDYEFPAGPKSLNGKLKLIGFYRFEHSPTVSRFDIFGLTGRSSGSRFLGIADEAETIGRAEYSWSKKQGRDWQLGVEGAFNFLDNESTLRILDVTTGNFNDVAVDGATSRVEEKRAEATLTHSRALSPKWDLQTSIGVEYSEISQSGATGQTREFIRPKGFISATYKSSDTFKIRTKIEREVGQLNFFDFISSVSLQDDLNRTGNANLVPDQTWAAEIEFDKGFGQGNTLKIRFYGDLVSDLVDRIPVGIDGDAVGNIDSASRYGFDVNATLKGERWGINGTQLDLNFDYRNSSVDDPLTGVSRRLNNDKKTFWRIGFRHDIPNTKWAYGAIVGKFTNAAGFRLSTINNSSNSKPFSAVFIEHKDIFGLKVNARLNNVLGTSDDFHREVFTTRRDLGVLDFTEDRARPFGVIGRIRVSGTF